LAQALCLKPVNRARSVDLSPCRLEALTPLRMALLAVRNFLFLNLVSLAGAYTSDSCEEPVSLLQNDLKSKRRAAVKLDSKDESCQCLNWNETYDSKAVVCGQGFEFTYAAGHPIRKYPSAERWLHHTQKQRIVFDWVYGDEWCKDFYEKLNDNKCVKTAMDSSETEWYGKSWCYVSSSCSSAWPLSSTSVSAKLCEAGTDSMLGDMSPQELLDYGHRMGFNVSGDLLKFAYPLDRRFYWKDRANHTDEVSELMAASMLAPIVIDETNESLMDKVVLYGGRVYKLQSAGPLFDDSLYHDDTVDLSRVESWTLRCVENCPPQ